MMTAAMNDFDPWEHVDFDATDNLAPAPDGLADVLRAVEALTAEVAELRARSAPPPVPSREPTPPALAPPPLLCTIPQASKIVGIGVETLRAWVASGKLPRRTKGAAQRPKRPTFLVSVEEIRAAAAGKGKR